MLPCDYPIPTGNARALARLGRTHVFLHRTLKHQTIEVWGDGGVTRDFIYVGDVANAVYLATLNPIAGVFNVGTGTGLSIREILNRISRVVGIEVPVTWMPSRSFDVPRIVLDATKLKTPPSGTVEPHFRMASQSLPSGCGIRIFSRLSSNSRVSMEFSTRLGGNWSGRGSFPRDIHRGRLG